MTAPKDASRSAGASFAALSVLVALVVTAPWAFGSVDPLPRSLLATIGLATSAAVLLWRAPGRELPRPDVPLWPLGALFGLGLLQLVPLPAGGLRLLAPGPAEIWHPGAEVVARILGDGPRPLSLDPDATAEAWLLATALAGLALLAAPALSGSSAARRAACVVVAGGAVLAVYGIVARGRFGSLLFGHLAVPTVQPFGPFVSKNHFAGYVGPAALLAVGLAAGLAGRSGAWIHGRSAPGVVAALVAAAAMGLSILVSQSRGGVLAVLAGALVFPFARGHHRRSRTSRVPALAVGALVLAALAAMLPGEVLSRVTTLSGASFRLDTWRDSLRLAARSPLAGHGFAAFADAYAPAKTGYGAIRVEHAENEYVELLVEGGLAGLVLALLAAALPLARAVALGRHLDPLRRGLTTGALAGLVAFAVHGLVDFNLRIPSNAALAALLCAFVLAAVPAPPVRLSRLAATAGALLLLAGAARAATAPARSRAWAEVRAEVRAAAAAQSPEARSLRLARAEARLRALLRRRPGLAEGWLLLAAVRHATGARAEARVLADHAVRLDPTRAELRAGALALGEP